MKIDKTKLKNNLEKKLGRPATETEKVNAEKDPIILIEVLFEELELIKGRLSDLEK